MFSITPSHDGAIAFESCKGSKCGGDLGNSAQASWRHHTAKTPIAPSDDTTICFEGCKRQSIGEDIVDTAQP